MLIEIENTSSPGASFTANTNDVLLKTYNWITNNSGILLPFKQFRMRLQAEMGVNDNNNRNIYPLLKNGGLVTYEKGGDIFVDNFFTKTGLAYVKTITTEELIIGSEHSEEKKKEAIGKLELVRANIIADSLIEITKQKDINYVEPFQHMVQYLIEYRKISKTEFAYLLYCLQEKEISHALIDMKETIESLRNNSIEIEVRVKVRNDIELREKTNSEKRKEGLGFLTSYGYFISLLQQAMLINKEDSYYVVSQNREEILRKIGEA